MGVAYANYLYGASNRPEWDIMRLPLAFTSSALMELDMSILGGLLMYTESDAVPTLEASEVNPRSVMSQH